MIGDPKDRHENSSGSVADGTDSSNGREVTHPEYPELPEVVTTDAEKIKELEEEVQAARDGKNEIIFYFFLFLMIIIDMLGFQYLNGAIEKFLIVLLELVLLIGMARQFGVEWVEVHLVSLFKAILSRLGREK